MRLLPKKACKQHWKQELAAKTHRTEQKLISQGRTETYILHDMLVKFCLVKEQEVLASMV